MLFLTIILFVLIVALVIALMAYIVQLHKEITLLHERDEIINSLIITSIQFKYDLKPINLN